MFDDPKKELEDLEKKLLAAEEDDWLDKQLREARALIGDTPRKKKTRRPEDNAYRNYANGYGDEEQPRKPKPVKAAPKKEQVLYTDDYEDEDEEEEPREKGVRGLIVVACLETLGIVGIVAYWLLHLL